MKYENFSLTGKTALITGGAGLLGVQHAAAIYERLKLPEGSKISGPALLVQPDATTYIDPGLYAVVDDFGNIIMKQEVT